jgi:UDP-2,3-diacylglucosamine hydrolase
MQLPIYFFGDNHFSPTPSLSNEQKIKKMEEFILEIENSKGSIFIMGDFFDYYFEYNRNDPNYFERIFSLLEKIKTKGIEVYFIAGNHDFWIGKKFQSVITKSFLSDQILSEGNKRIYVTHGDGILSWDKGYRLLKFILRSKIFRFLYSLLPKNIALKVANKISYERKDSHKINNDKLEKIHSELIQYSRSKWDKGCDIVIMGHYHHSFNFSENQKQLIILDDCCDQQFNYAKYDGNSISIKSL